MRTSARRASSRRPARPRAMTRMPSSAPATSAGGSNASSRSTSPVMSNVCSTLVGTFGSSRRASACAAIDSSKRPQYRQAWTRPAKSSGSLPCRLASFSRRTSARCALADVGFQVRVELVRHGQMRIELERPAEAPSSARVFALGRRRARTCRSRDDSDRGEPTPAQSASPGPATPDTESRARASPS